MALRQAMIVAAVLLAGYMLWHGPRCTGPTQADRCAMGAAP
jgi:hypothetical protein